jgi:hypothetical protein
MITGLKCTSTDHRVQFFIVKYSNNYFGRLFRFASNRCKSYPSWWFFYAKNQLRVLLNHENASLIQRSQKISGKFMKNGAFFVFTASESFLR